MDDLKNHNTNYILQDQNGVKWHFYLSENKRIMYTNNQQGEWSTHEYIESQPIRGYAATMDKSGVIRIVAYTTTRQLLYYEFINGKWSQQVIERIYSRFQDVPYFSIHSSALGVHILCYINHSLSRSGETLMHYFLQENKWHGGKLWKFMSDQITTIQSTCIDHDNKLHVLFTQRWRQRIHLYYCVYDPLTLSWVEPIAIHSSSSKHRYQIHVDHSENLHILWSESAEMQYQIRYLLKLTDHPNSNWHESLIHEGSHEIIAPLIIEDNGLYCFWKEDKAIYRMHTMDSGLTWSAPELLKDSLDYDLGLQNFIYLDKGIPKAMDVWGQGYPDIKLAGINWHPILSKKLVQKKSQPKQPSSSEDTNQREVIEWTTDVKRSLTSIKQENKSLREAINNLFSQIDHLNSIIYSLQDQMQINERSIFNISTRIKQSDFQIKQLQLKSRPASPKLYDMQNIEHQPIPIRMDEKGKIITDRSTNMELDLDEAEDKSENLGNQALKSKNSDDIYDGSDKNKMGDKNFKKDKESAKEDQTSKGREDINNNEIVKDKESIDDNERMGDKESIDNNKIMRDKESIDGNEIMRDKESIDDNKIMGDKESIDDNKTMRDKESIDDNEIMRDKESIDDNEIMRDKESIDDNDSLDDEYENPYHKKKDTQRISLGNTVILVNPEEPKEL